MSIHVLSWVLRNSDAKLADRLVLLVLADHAKADGTCAWPSVETIAHEARLSRRSVQSSLRSLERDKLVTSTGKSRTGTIIYTVAMVEAAADSGGADIAPVQNLRGAKCDVRGAQNTSEGGANPAPEPSIKQSSIKQPSIVCEKLDLHLIEFDEQFWPAFPKNRRVAKKQALDAYRSARKRTDAETIIDALTAAVAVWVAERRPASKIPHAATWLNGDRWDDEACNSAAIGDDDLSIYDAGIVRAVR